MENWIARIIQIFSKSDDLEKMMDSNEIEFESILEAASKILRKFKIIDRNLRNVQGPMQS